MRHSLRPTPPPRSLGRVCQRSMNHPSLSCQCKWGLSVINHPDCHAVTDWKARSSTAHPAEIKVKRRQDKQTHDKTRTDLQQAESYRILTVLRWAEQSQAALEYKGENAFRISAHFISKGERQQKCQTLKGKTYCDLLDTKAGGGTVEGEEEERVLLMVCQGWRVGGDWRQKVCRAERLWRWLKWAPCLCVCVRRMCVTKTPEEQQGGRQIICLIGYACVLTTALDYTLNKDPSVVSGRFPRAENTFTVPGERLCHHLRTRKENRGMERWFKFDAAVPYGGSYERAEFRGGQFEAHHAKQQDQRNFLLKCDLASTSLDRSLEKEGKEKETEVEEMEEE